MLRSILKAADRMTGAGLSSKLREAALASDRLPDAECSCCGFVGRFRSAGKNPRAGVRCPKCNSLERHRLLALAMQRGEVNLGGRSVLHFAPETIVARLIEKQRPASYRTSSYPDRGEADLCLNIEKIDLPDGSVDAVMCNHVLEHVDDRKSLAEIYRIVAPGGMLVAMVPIVEGWEMSYENPEVVDDDGRTRHYGQEDHVRYYGADFRQRVRDAGFSLNEITAGGADSARYRLTRGEKVFLGTK